MTFTKTVAAYLTGWLIVQPLYNRLLNAYRKREMEHPSEETLVYFERQAKAIVNCMEYRNSWPPRVCPRCLRPYGEHGRNQAHGPGFCIERKYADADAFVLSTEQAGAVLAYIQGDHFEAHDIDAAVRVLAPPDKEEGMGTKGYR
jgi:hypothetical protein